MSRKTLNTVNLAALGPERLAELLMEVSTGSAAIKRRLRLELSHTLGPDALAHDLRKRLATLRRAKAYVGWRKRKSLITDLETQRRMISEKIAPDAPAEGFELLWQFIELAPSVLARVDDSRGEVRAVFLQALPPLAHCATGHIPAPDLARRLWDSLRDDADDIWTDAIPLMAEPLGTAGLDALKAQITAQTEAPAPEEPAHAALQFLRELRDQNNTADTHASRLARRCLQDIATAQGDIDAYIAQIPPQALLDPGIAANAANRLHTAGRAEEALALLHAAAPAQATHPAWNAAFTACLTATGRQAEAQAHHLACFHQTLDVDALRAYLKPLPDFDDIEAEDAAKAHALAFHDAVQALAFLTQWPDLHLAAQLAQTRIAELEGAPSQLLIPAAEALRARYPLAATVLWRQMIETALWQGRSGSYATAADMIMDCASVADEITGFGPHPDHSAYMAYLRETYASKRSFWARIG